MELTYQFPTLNTLHRNRLYFNQMGGTSATPIAPEGYGYQNDPQNAPWPLQTAQPLSFTKANCKCHIFWQTVENYIAYLEAVGSSSAELRIVNKN